MPTSDPTFVPVSAWLDTSQTTVRVRFSLKVLANAALTTAANYSVAGNTVSAAAAITDDPYAVKLTLGTALSGSVLLTVTTGVILDSTSTFAITSPGNTVPIKPAAQGVSSSVPTSCVRNILKFILAPIYGGVIAANIAPSTATALKSIVGSGSTVTLTFNRDIALGGAATSPTSYLIVNEKGEILPISAVTAGVAGSSTVVLATSELGSTHTYTLVLPGTGIMGADTGTSLLAPFTRTFTGSSTHPVLVSAQSINNRTVEVVFSKAMDPVSATNPANYVIINPSVQVLSVAQVSPQIFRLTTTTELPSTTYNLFALNVTDAAGNSL